MLYVRYSMLKIRLFIFLKFQIHTSRMTLSDDVNLEEFITAKDELSGADIKVNAVIIFALFAYLHQNMR